MQTVYLICAVVGGTLIVCQFLAILVGLGGHHDLGGHDAGGHDLGGHDGVAHDGAGHHEAGHGSEPNWFFSLLTLRTLTAAFAFFGLAGLAASGADMEPVQSLAIALGAGALAILAVGWLMRLLIKLNVDGTVRIERAVGARGTVYLSVPGARSGVGKVHVNQLNRTIEYKAVTAQDQLPTGAEIVVVGIVGADTVEVRGQKSEVRDQKSEDRSQRERTR
jgi:membrane protein implicated in regulation of membrane protease activity